MADNCGRLSTRDVLVAFVTARLRAAGSLSMPQVEQVAACVSRTVDPIVYRLLDFDNLVMNDCSNRQFIQDTASDLILRRGRYDNGAPCALTDSDRVTEAITSLLDVMFEDNVQNWGRFDTVVIYVNQLCRAAACNCRPELAMVVIDTVSCYFRRNNFDTWIQARGGWEAMPGEMGSQQGVMGVVQNFQDPVLRAAATSTVQIGRMIASLVRNIMCNINRS